MLGNVRQFEPLYTEFMAWLTKAEATLADLEQRAAARTSSASSSPTSSTDHDFTEEKMHRVSFITIRL